MTAWIMSSTFSHDVSVNVIMFGSKIQSLFVARSFKNSLKLTFKKSIYFPTTSKVERKSD